MWTMLLIDQKVDTMKKMTLLLFVELFLQVKFSLCPKFRPCLTARLCPLRELRCADLTVVKVTGEMEKGHWYLHMRFRNNKSLAAFKRL